MGGNRNQQTAACKRFKPQWRSMELEYFQNDFKIADTAITYAEEWNAMDDRDTDEKILITKGHIVKSNSGLPYLVEPFIRNFRKFTSNSGWIDQDESWITQALEAFSHYTYHSSGGFLIVCDLQGRYRDNRRFGPRAKSRFELTDPAICSRNKSYGPTDLSEKGIESFFANHTCNEFCKRHWQSPRNQRSWFPGTSATSMFPSSVAHKLLSTNHTQFAVGRLGAIEEKCNSYSDSDSDEEADNRYSDSDDSW